MARIRYLLDTNILSEPLVARPNARVLEQIEKHSHALAIAVVTWQELLYGLFLLPPGKRRKHIEDYLFHRVRPTLPIIALDERAAHWQAEQRARLRQSGRTASYPDSEIAAIAAVNDCILVTRNLSDFEAFQGLRLENWFEPA
ncbi:type II toxin-antitoxin system VapC family toxin [Allochromatium palmeri]|uniref:Ribonuclease VapC n=1 Tax=Allochromatium palmeri TaxID=231048 RepID=A0A6N8EFV6_9GAMM|nr:type II toxin-antitoxin system VapC family toxin [Allochromatium palmeri]MTW22430.1 PIN domain-containing protein [Allochromatium palmeri]